MKRRREGGRSTAEHYEKKKNGPRSDMGERANVRNLRLVKGVAKKTILADLQKATEGAASEWREQRRGKMSVCQMVW